MLRATHTVSPESPGRAAAMSLVLRDSPKGCDPLVGASDRFEGLLLGRSLKKCGEKKQHLLPEAPH